MPRFSANISMLFAEREWLDRPAAAAASGFGAIMSRIGHIQFADNPGRHEPGTGGIDYPAVFAALDRLGYDGWAAAEYWPSRTTEETLGWMTGAG